MKTFKYIYHITKKRDNMDEIEILNQLKNNAEEIEPTTRGIQIPTETLNALQTMLQEQPSFKYDVEKFNKLCGLRTKHPKAPSLTNKINKQQNNFKIKIGTTNKGFSYTIQLLEE